MSVSRAWSSEVWEPVIGLEIHAQLLTQTKLFCACETSFGAEPNVHCCPVCLGLPGALPVMNRAALELALRAALSLDCGIQATSIFARKNYFYPDLPKGYQISQYEEPLALAGKLRIASDSEAEGAEREVGITRIHMEEDAGKNVHHPGGDSIVDLNRAGTPLIEIVGEPDLRSPAEARDYMKRLREVLMFAGVNDGNLEQGSFRCDANVSVRRRGEEAFGTRVELKNINSFRFVEEALEVEIARQIALIESGGRVTQQTRGYNADKRETYLLRDKEGDAGYRYFPDPDLPPLVVPDELLAEVTQTLPARAADLRADYVKRGLSDYAAGVITGHPEVARFFEAALAAYPGEPVKLANFIQAEVLRDVSTDGLDATLPVSPVGLAELLALVDAGTISGKQAKRVYSAMVESQQAPAAIVAELGLEVISDASALEAIIAEVIAANPSQVEAYRGGKTALLGYFVGQIMKATKGSADPKLANQLIRAALEGGDG